MTAICVIMLIILIIWIIKSPSTFFIGLIIFIGICILDKILNGKKRELKRKEKYLEYEKKNKEYEEELTEHNISCNTLIVNCRDGSEKIAETKQYIWVEDNNLCFLPIELQNNGSDSNIYKIPIKDIEYYSIQGSLTQETIISGGGGEVGGSSIGGAIIGGIIAGSTGAIIGSRKKGKIEPIKSETVTHDDRITFMNYFINNVRHTMFFDFEDYETFSKIIPEKKHDNQINNQCGEKTEKTTALQQLKDLAELKANGILTDEEFAEKKKILLDKIK